MRPSWRMVVIAALGTILVLGLTVLVVVLGTGTSQAQQGTMHNCPAPGKWSIAVWEGESGAAAADALATCGADAVAAAYSLDSQTGAWSRWFTGLPHLSTLATLGNLQGIIALGAAQATATPTPNTSVTPQPTLTPTQTVAPTATQTTVVEPPPQACCKICTTGKACGDSCISKSYTCHQPPGCACNG